MRTWQKILFWILLLAIGSVGAVLLSSATPQGMGLVNDSVGYIGGARNIVAGNGYSRLTGNGEARVITNYPPLYSIVLSLPIRLGADSLAAAWWLNLLLFFLNSVLIGWIVYRFTKSAVFGLAAPVLFIASTPFFKAHTFALSEPVFILVYLLSVFFLIIYLVNKKWVYLALSGFMASLAVLTRYVGFSLFITTGIMLLLYQESWKKRIRDGIIFLAASIPLIFTWMLRNFLVTGNAANRQFIFHPIPQDKIDEGLYQFWNWLVPSKGNLLERLVPYWGWIFLVLVGALLVLVLLGIWFARRNKMQTRHTWFTPFLVIGFQALSFLAVLFASLLFVDASPPLDDRIVIPFTLLLLILGVGILGVIWRQKSILLKLAAVLAAVVLLLSFSEDTLDLVRSLNKDGQGFASSYWQESPTVAKVGEYMDRTIFTNKPTALYILINKPAYTLLSPTNPATGLPREDYPEFVSSVRERVSDGRSLLVIFDYMPLMEDPAEKDWIDDFSEGLPVLARLGDDVIFGIEQ